MLHTLIDRWGWGASFEHRIGGYVPMVPMLTGITGDTLHSAINLSDHYPIVRPFTHASSITRQLPFAGTVCSRASERLIRDVKELPTCEKLPIYVPDIHRVWHQGENPAAFLAVVHNDLLLRRKMALPASEPTKLYGPSGDTIAKDWESTFLIVRNSVCAPQVNAKHWLALLAFQHAANEATFDLYTLLFGPDKQKRLQKLREVFATLQLFPSFRSVCFRPFIRCMQLLLSRVVPQKLRALRDACVFHCRVYVAASFTPEEHDVFMCSRILRVTMFEVQPIFETEEEFVWMTTLRNLSGGLSFQQKYLRTCRDFGIPSDFSVDTLPVILHNTLDAIDGMTNHLRNIILGYCSCNDADANGLKDELYYPVSFIKDSRVVEIHELPNGLDAIETFCDITYFDTTFGHLLGTFLRTGEYEDVKLVVAATRKEGRASFSCHTMTQMLKLMRPEYDIAKNLHVGTYGQFIIDEDESEDESEDVMEGGLCVASDDGAPFKYHAIFFTNDRPMQNVGVLSGTYLKLDATALSTPNIFIDRLPWRENTGWQKVSSTDSNSTDLLYILRFVIDIKMSID